MRYHNPNPIPGITDKISGNVYFNINDIDISIFKKQTFDEKVLDLIKSYPSLFIHYYSFDSDIRTRYKYIDILITALTASYKIFNLCIRYLISKYGLISFYNKHAVNIYSFHKEKDVHNLQIAASANNDFNSYLLLVKTIISSESDLCDSEYFSKIYLAECILYQYQMSSKTEPEVYRLDFDIVKLRKEDIFFEKDTFIKIYKEDNSVRVARLKIEFSRG